MKKSGSFRKPYKKGFLTVSNGHNLYYELYGNPKGKPVLFLHGGPGGGCSKRDKRFFNPKKINVIFFDQRGAGKSRPFASTKANTTWHLVEDIKKLLAHLGLKKVFLFGGSWGSTLALIYAINYPETVSRMLLRGIFLADSSDTNYFINGPAKELCPEAYERFTKIVPKKFQKNIPKYYHKQMNSKNPKTRKTFLFEWGLYEQSIMPLEYNLKKALKRMKKWNYTAVAKIENHYFINNCFLPKNYIIKNASKLSKIPTIIIHGRYDLVCSPLSAYKLHKKIKNSKLFFVTAGHSAKDKQIETKLIEEMKKYENKRQKLGA
jgi:proline iminopeptidase